MNLKNFFITLFIKQNKYHKHSVLGHTFKVFYECLKAKRFDLLTTAILHDIGKPFVAYQKPEDIKNKEYSFTNHEEKSYQIIKHWPISKRTKLLVRYHYLLRSMSKAKQKKDIKLFKQKQETWNSLSKELQQDLRFFQKCDDKGKK